MTEVGTLVRSETVRKHSDGIHRQNLLLTQKSEWKAGNSAKIASIEEVTISNKCANLNSTPAALIVDEYHQNWYVCFRKSFDSTSFCSSQRKGVPVNARSRCVVLLSGGLDSATVLAVARDLRFDICAITFRYGQRHAVEVEAAKRIAAAHDVAKHAIVDVDLGCFGGSALTSETPVPKDRDPQLMASGIPITYVPARNTVFLSFALAYAEVVEAFDIFVGMNALDYAGYPDCRPEYVTAFEAMANLATKAAVQNEQRIRIHTPLIQMSKSEIIRKGLSMGVDYSLTSSCYDPTDDGASCGRCDTCVLRLDGFEQNGVHDPIMYCNTEVVTQ